MAVTNQHLVIAKKVLTALTWKRILILFLLLAAFLSATLGWTFRDQLFKGSSTVENRLSVNPGLVVSVNIKNEIDSIVRRSPIILGIKIVSINFQRNIRTDSYANFDHPVVSEVYTLSINNKVYETPLFTENKDTNKQVLRLISGEFLCIPFEQTTAYKLTPTLNSFVKYVCSSAIPPYHGDFSGFLTIYLGMEPTKDDKERLFLLSRDISLKIYEENKHGKDDNR